MNARGADLYKSQGGVQSVGRQVWRARIDLADNTLMAGPSGILKQVLIKSARMTAPAR
jgi:hypothetical protein